jgi:protein-S-isoprenylcysteine O-methyltransferase Ste14
MSDQDLVFRMVVLALFIGIRCVRWHARQRIGWRASWPAMKNHPLDTALLLTLGVLWLGAVVVYAAVPASVARFAAPVPAAVRWVAVAVAVAGLALLRWADRCLGENLSVSLRVREHHTLVTTGPYRYVRHPIYVATLLYAAGLAVITANYLLGAAFLVPMVLVVAKRLTAEEQMMIDTFGDEYRAYMQATGRLLPKRQRS